MVVNLAIGFITPPVGVNLFVACGIGKVRFEDLVSSILPFLAILLVALLLITYIPAITLLLPRLLGR
jgi:C4-dicarboxylate transporter DctM subunit